MQNHSFSSGLKGLQAPSLADEWSYGAALATQLKQSYIARMTSHQELTGNICKLMSISGALGLTSSSSPGGTVAKRFSSGPLSSVCGTSLRYKGSTALSGAFSS